LRAFANGLLVLVPIKLDFWISYAQSPYSEVDLNLVFFRYNFGMDKMDHVGVSIWGAFFGIIASLAIFGMDKPYSAMFFAGGGAVLGYIFAEAIE
jgi:hypothetical protein